MTSLKLRLPRHDWGTRTIDAYEKIECIGAGTYGRVYRAKNRATGEIVALKKIRTLNETQGLPVTTIREIKLLKYLQHKNIVRIVEVIVAEDGDDDEDSDEPSESESKFIRGALYLVLEYVEHDLTGLIDRQYRYVNGFTDEMIKCIMQQLFRALHHLHINNYVHRDIKCSNLLLTNNHVLKLADFGLARSIQGNQELTNKVVTLWYRPPELLLGATAYDSSLDMWSAGCVLAELYLGSPLFPGKNDIEQLTRIFEVCGSPTRQNWSTCNLLPHSDKWMKDSTPGSKLESSLRKAMEAKNRPLPLGTAELISSLLQLNPAERMSAEEALDSKFFSVRPLPPDSPERSVGRLAQFASADD